MVLNRGLEACQIPVVAILVTITLEEACARNEHMYSSSHPVGEQLDPQRSNDPRFAAAGEKVPDLPLGSDELECNVDADCELHLTWRLRHLAQHHRRS